MSYQAEPWVGKTLKPGGGIREKNSSEDYVVDKT